MNELCAGVQGLGRISKYEPPDSLYIKLEQPAIPPGWPNDPLYLGLSYPSSGMGKLQK